MENAIAKKPCQRHNHKKRVLLIEMSYKFSNYIFTLCNSLSIFTPCIFTLYIFPEIFPIYIHFPYTSLSVLLFPNSLN